MKNYLYSFPPENSGSSQCQLFMNITMIMRENSIVEYNNWVEWESWVHVMAVNPCAWEKLVSDQKMCKRGTICFVIIEVVGTHPCFPFFAGHFTLHTFPLIEVTISFSRSTHMNAIISKGSGGESLSDPTPISHHHEGFPCVLSLHFSPSLCLLR